MCMVGRGLGWCWYCKHGWQLHCLIEEMHIRKEPRRTLCVVHTYIPLHSKHQSRNSVCRVRVSDAGWGWEMRVLVSVHLSATGSGA